MVSNLPDRLRPGDPGAHRRLQRRVGPRHGRLRQHHHQAGSNEFHGGAWVYTGTPLLRSAATVERSARPSTRNVYGTRACSGDKLLPRPRRRRRRPHRQGQALVLRRLHAADRAGRSGTAATARIVEDAANPGEPDFDPTKVAAARRTSQGQGPVRAASRRRTLMTTIAGSPEATGRRPRLQLPDQAHLPRQPGQRRQPHRSSARPARAAASSPGATPARSQLDRAQDRDRQLRPRRCAGSASSSPASSRSRPWPPTTARKNHQARADPATCRGRRTLPARSLSEYNTPRATRSRSSARTGSAGDKYPGSPTARSQGFYTGGYGYYDYVQGQPPQRDAARDRVRARAGHHAIKVGFDPQVDLVHRRADLHRRRVYQERLPGRPARRRPRTGSARSTARR